MEKIIIHTDNAPAAVGPYSQGVAVGHIFYSAGQIALDPATGKLTGENITEQTDRALKNLQAILEEAGSSLQNVIKTTVFLSDIALYKEMNGVYAQYFGESKPARSAFAVAALPLGALVEIEAVALIG